MRGRLRLGVDGDARGGERGYQFGADERGATAEDFAERGERAGAEVVV